MWSPSLTGADGGGGSARLRVALVTLADGDVIVRDRETGSTWSGLSGEAIDGPLAGRRLQQLPTFYAFWFSWTDFFT